jgi:hypothetical protein
MSDSVGALPLPAPAPTVWPPLDRSLSPGDPALLHLASFAATVLQVDVGAAWTVLDPGRPDQPLAIDGARLGTGPVRRCWFSDPREGYFAPEDLPGLFVYRSGVNATEFERWSADNYHRNSRIAIAWIPPQAEEDAKRRERDPFFNAVSSALHRAFVFRRHAAWVRDEDLADEDGLVSAAQATSASPVTLSGAQLDGPLAGAALTPGRPVQLTTSAAAGAYNVTDAIVITGTLDNGVAHTDRLFLTDTNGGETIVGTWSFATVTSVAIPAQFLTTGAITLGYYASPEAKFGSLVQRPAGLVKLALRSIAVAAIPVKRGTDTPLNHRCLELLLDVVESLGIDPLEHAEAYDPTEAAGLTATFAQGNFNPFNSFEL